MMKGKSLFIIVGLAALSLIAGWWQAELARYTMPQEIDRWDLDFSVEIDSKKYTEVASVLHTSDIFPISKEERESRAELKASDEEFDSDLGREFPMIVGASVLNGVPHIHLRLENETIVTVKSGDELESGWKLLSVGLDQVNAEYNEEKHDFWVTNYNLKTDESEN